MTDKMTRYEIEKRNWERTHPHATAAEYDAFIVALCRRLRL